MEVSGRKPHAEIQKSSQSDVCEFCLPCENAGEKVPAKGFCETCEHYLCATCFSAHTIPLPCRNHVLLNENTMAKRKTTKARKVRETKKDKITQPCSIRCHEHNHKVIDFFCLTHNVVVCGICAVQKHKPCNVNYIPEVAEGYKDTTEYKTLLNNMDELQTDVTTLYSDVEENISSLPNLVETVLEDIRAFRKKINKHLIKKENELILAVQSMEREDSGLLQNLFSDINCLKAETSACIEQLKSTENTVSDLFVTSKQSALDLKSLSERLIQCSKRNKKVKYHFTRAQTMLGLPLASNVIGSVEKTYSLSKLDLKNGTIKRMPNLKTKVPKDTMDNIISGLALISTDLLLFLDYLNCSVKTVETTTNKITSLLPLSSTPFGVTTMPHHQAAVTLPYREKIKIISTKGALSTLRSINVAGECRGIEYSMKKLFVSYRYPPKVEIIDPHKKVVISKIEVDNNSGAKMFELPQDVAVVKGEVSVLYISDMTRNTVTELSLGGKRGISKHTNKSWTNLEGLAVTGDGQLLVCNCKNHTVDIVDKDGKKVWTLLDKSDGIEFPTALCYCANNNTLYVSSRKVNVPVKVYRLF